ARVCLSDRPLRDRAGLVHRAVVRTAAGRRWVRRDALVLEPELVLLVEVELHRVAGRRGHRRGHVDAQGDGLPDLHVGRQVGEVRADGDRTRGVVDPAVAENDRVDPRRGPYPTTVVGHGHARARALTGDQGPA